MIFYCFPRIIGRVHREGKAIHQSAAGRETWRGEGTEGKGDGGREWCVCVCVCGCGVQYENGGRDKRGQVG